MKETTFTVSTSKYDNITLQSIASFVYGASNEKEAIENAKHILKHYEDRLSFWKLLKLMFKYK